MAEFDKTEDKKVQEVLIKKAELLKNRKNRTFYANMGTVAVLGGIITCPLLIGIFLGGWFDKVLNTEKISWRLNLMLVGFLFGVYYAYRWIKYEGIEKIDEAYRKEHEGQKDNGTK